MPFPNKLFWLIFLTATQIWGCRQNIDPTTELPGNRSFHMGFTAFPYDLSTQAHEASYQNALNNGDILLLHLDHGVPWNEALNDQPFPDEIENTLSATLAGLPADFKLMVTVTATSITRDSLANYWNNNGSHQPLPAPWDGYGFATPEVITAYIKYCRRVIEQTQPDYFAYGIEVNASFKENTQAFTDYLTLVDTVYQTLKADYPQLPVFLTFQDQSFNKNQNELLQLTSLLLPYSDMIAVSTYPFWLFDYPTREANPQYLPDDWLTSLHDLDPTKPFAISETGYCAEDLVIPEFGVNIKGSPEWQRAYVEALLAKTNELNAEFVLWFVYRDYDLLYDNTPNPSPIFKIWKDNGLEDGTGNKRPAHSLWSDWLNLPTAK